MKLRAHELYNDGRACVETMRHYRLRSTPKTSQLGSDYHNLKNFVILCGFGCSHFKLFPNLKSKLLCPPVFTTFEQQNRLPAKK